MLGFHFLPYTRGPPSFRPPALLVLLSRSPSQYPRPLHFLVICPNDFAPLSLYLPARKLLVSQRIAPFFSASLHTKSILHLAAPAVPKASSENLGTRLQTQRLSSSSADPMSSSFLPPGLCTDSSCDGFRLTRPVLSLKLTPSKRPSFLITLACHPVNSQMQLLFIGCLTGFQDSALDSVPSGQGPGLSCQ